MRRGSGVLLCFSHRDRFISDIFHFDQCDANVTALRPVGIHFIDSGLQSSSLPFPVILLMLLDYLGLPQQSRR
jgi:hypothetical protein